MTTFDFSHLKRYDPRGRKAWLTLPLESHPDHPELGAPRLQMRHAGRTNTAYAQAVAKRNASKTQQGRATRALDAMADNLATDRALFPKYVICGWEAVFDATGRPASFSESACASFLEQLPDWIVERVSIFAANPANFIDDEMPDEVEVAVQAGE